MCIEMSTKRRQLNLLLILALPAVLWLFTNAAINIHIHQLSDGTYISHSHPYNKNTENREAVPGHQHSKKQYQLLQMISLPEAIVLIITLVCLSIQSGCTRLKLNIIPHRPRREYYGVLTYRGPPSV